MTVGTVVDSDSFRWLGPSGTAISYAYLDLMNGKTGTDNISMIVGPYGGSSVALEIYDRMDRDVRHAFTNNPHAVGFYMRFPSGFPANTDFFIANQSGFGGSGAGAVFSLQVDASGFIRFAGGSPTTVNIRDASWHYIEVYMSTTDGIGPHFVNVDGVFATSKSVSGGFTIGGYWDYVSWLTPNTLLPIDISDYYSLYDGNGDVASSLLGPVRVEYLAPTGAGTFSQFTPSSTTTHFSLVDETPPNGLTDYVYSGNVGDIDSYTHGSIVSTGVVKATVVKAIADRSASPARSLETGVISSGVTGVGVPYSLPGGNVSPFSPTVVTAIRQFDPNTTAVWTIAAVNATEMIIKVQA